MDRGCWCDGSGVDCFRGDLAVQRGEGGWCEEDSVSGDELGELPVLSIEIKSME